MIAYLRGRVALLGEDHCVLDVGGVGYLVHASSRTLRELPPHAGTAELLIDTRLREDAILLYGFKSDAERVWFRLLQTVQGVGARAALALLGALGVDGLATAVMAQDKASLTRASGVGARLAGRIVSELKDRQGEIPVSLLIEASSAPAISGGITEDALSALVNLGYGRSEAHAALVKAMREDEEHATIDSLIRRALRELSE